ncbi:MAG: hypothetical protein SP4CHLAM5_09670 [Chlamydiia bacterium]|nr:hypothetical protein [Chlamydiia bacterium]MCH9618825.1 hypothetical protein [Chlamydiia bacterium]MCH9624373.1 hypothetical protein [Chlamydiia bacterium]
MLDNLISDLEKYLKTALIQEEDKEGITYLFSLNDESEIYLKERSYGIYITSTICHFSEQAITSPEDFYIYLMKANYLGIGTGNSIISIAPGEKFLTLSLLIDYEVNYKMFRDLLEDFVNYRSYWSVEINKKLGMDK